MYELSKYYLLEPFGWPLTRLLMLHLFALKNPTKLKHQLLDSFRVPIEIIGGYMVIEGRGKADQILSV